MTALPQWINWNETPYRYRKITNIWGGSETGGELQWLSRFDTTTAKGGDSISAPVFDANPENMWFLDTESAKLKVSDANDPITLTINPVQSCLQSKDGHNCDANCCSTSSSYGYYNANPGLGGKTHSSTGEDGGCVYQWSFASNKNCLFGGSQFYGPNRSTCDRWTYFGTDPSMYGNTDIGGTFCNNASNTDHRMRTYIGCDCNPSGKDCTNITRGAGCTDDSLDDYHLSTYDRAYWKFIDDAGAFACCSLDYNTAKSKMYPQCIYAFDPTADANKCPTVVQQYCQNHWGDTTEIGNQCTIYLATSPQSCSTIQQTIENYITNPSRIPQDYISKPLARSGHQPSLAYYNTNHCDTTKSCSDSSNPCCRDDSTDPFFMSTMPFLCNAGNSSCPTNPSTDHTTGKSLGICDAQLQYFCQSFTQDDLAADATLQHICGCFLLTNTDPAAAPTNPVINGVKMDLDYVGPGFNPTTTPYYSTSDDITGYACDVMCNSALIQSQTFDGKCTQNVCIIDNVNVTYVNSDSNGSYIDQNCGEGSSCYIQNVSLTSINSSITGQSSIEQQCGSCYTFDDDVQQATPVDCNTLQPYGPSPPPDNGGGGGGSGGGGSPTDHRKFLLIIIIVLLIGAALFFIYSYFKNKSQRRMMGSGLYDDGGVYFDPGYWDGY